MSTTEQHFIGITKKENIDIAVKYFRRMLTECSHGFKTTYKLSNTPNEYSKSIDYNVLQFSAFLYKVCYENRIDSIYGITRIGFPGLPDHVLNPFIEENTFYIFKHVFHLFKNDNFVIQEILLNKFLFHNIKLLEVEPHIKDDEKYSEEDDLRIRDLTITPIVKNRKLSFNYTLEPY